MTWSGLLSAAGSITDRVWSSFQRLELQETLLLPTFRHLRIGLAFLNWLRRSASCGGPAEWLRPSGLKLFARVDVRPSRHAFDGGGEVSAGRSYAMAMTGTVKFFNGERGYGFIKPDDGGRDVFVHITAVERAGLKSLMEGQRISFEVEPDKKGKGPKAVNLVVTG